MPLIAALCSINKKHTHAAKPHTLGTPLPPLHLPLLPAHAHSCCGCRLQPCSVLSNCKCVPVPVRWSTSHPFEQSGRGRQAAFTHSTIQPFTHSLSHIDHLATWPFWPFWPVMQSTLVAVSHAKCSRSRRACCKWHVASGKREGGKSAAGCHSVSASCGMWRA